ncbi:MAG: M48 family metallopeptidase [Nitrosomonas sp.]|nr:M48 family metallopeptidase [Nitrosomonas sp.]
MLQRICLAGQAIDYRLKRTRRRTIGLKIDHEGLQVSVPFDFPRGYPYAQIDMLLQSRADWILKKLDAWQNKKQLNHAGALQNQALYPLLGDLWRPEIEISGQIQMVPVVGNGTTKPPDLALQITPEQLQKWIHAWYRQQALICFGERIELYADKLGVPKPPFKLSNAKTRWGSCNSRGMVRLNWRLVQLPLHVVDYVVAHELCHLIEMNHSPRFWQRVAAIYPDYQRARAKLRECQFIHLI